jgi:hypothetical protein
LDQNWTKTGPNFTVLYRLPVNFGGKVFPDRVSAGADRRGCFLNLMSKIETSGPVSWFILSQRIMNFWLPVLTRAGAASLKPKQKAEGAKKKETSNIQWGAIVGPWRPNSDSGWRR